jgi:hypothetical protein
MCLVGLYLDDGSPYWPSPLGGVVLSLLRDVGMTSDRTKKTVVPSVLAGSVRREQARLARLNLSRSSQGSRRWSGRESSRGVRPR